MRRTTSFPRRMRQPSARLRPCEQSPRPRGAPGGAALCRLRLQTWATHLRPPPPQRRPPPGTLVRSSRLVRALLQPAQAAYARRRCMLKLQVMRLGMRSTQHSGILLTQQPVLPVVLCMLRQLCACCRVQAGLCPRQRLLLGCSPHAQRCLRGRGPQPDAPWLPCGRPALPVRRLPHQAGEPCSACMAYRQAGCTGPLLSWPCSHASAGRLATLQVRRCASLLTWCW